MTIKKIVYVIIWNLFPVSRAPFCSVAFETAWKCVSELPQTAPARPRTWPLLTHDFSVAAFRYPVTEIPPSFFLFITIVLVLWPKFKSGSNFTECMMNTVNTSMLPRSWSTSKSLPSTMLSFLLLTSLQKKLGQSFYRVSVSKSIWNQLKSDPGLHSWQGHQAREAADTCKYFCSVVYPWCFARHWFYNWCFVRHWNMVGCSA